MNTVADYLREHSKGIIIGGVLVFVTLGIWLLWKLFRKRE